MRLERILTREYWAIGSINQILWNFNTQPIIKLKSTNKFRITVTATWNNIASPPTPNNHPQLAYGIRNIGENLKTYTNYDNTITNQTYYSIQSNQRTSLEPGQSNASTFNSVNIEPFTVILDEYPTNFQTFVTLFPCSLFTSLNIGKWYLLQGFTFKIEELTHDCPYDYLPKVKQIYQQTFYGKAYTQNYQMIQQAKFYWNRYQLKDNKNRWLCSIKNMSCDIIGGGIRNNQNMLRLNIPDANASIILNEGQTLHKVEIDMTLAGGGSSGTLDNIIVAWLYDTGNYSDYEVVATAPPAGDVISVTFNPETDPQGDVIHTVVGARLSCSGNDGYYIQTISINGVASSNIGWIDINSSTGEPPYRDYPTDLTRNIHFVEQSISGGCYSARLTQNWIATSDAIAPNQFMLSQLNDFFYGQVVSISSTGSLMFLGNNNKFQFSIQIEEIEDEYKNI